MTDLGISIVIGQFLESRKPLLPRIKRMCADTQPLRNLCRRIAPLDNLRHGFPFELVGKIKFAHIGLLASNLGKKVSTNLGAIQNLKMGN